MTEDPDGVTGDRLQSLNWIAKYHDQYLALTFNGRDFEQSANFEPFCHDGEGQMNREVTQDGLHVLVSCDKCFKITVIDIEKGTKFASFKVRKFLEVKLFKANDFKSCLI